MDRLCDGGYDDGMSRRRNTKSNPFRYFDSSPEVIRLEVMMYVRILVSYVTKNEINLRLFGF